MVYCESYSDEKVIEVLEGSRSVILVGCPGCANTCIYLKDCHDDSLPMLTISPTGFTAVSMQGEMERMERLLSRNYHVGTFMGKYPMGILCVFDKRGRKKIIKNCEDYDAVVTLCCDGGTKSISKVMKGKKVVPAMRATGIVSALMKTNLIYTKLSIYKDSVDIVRFAPDT